MIPSSITTSSSTFVKKHLSGIFLIVCLIVASVFAGFYIKTDILIREQLRQQGKAAFDAIRLHRQWASSHNGVYVKQTPGMTVNPYLKSISGIKSIIHDQDGDTYILKNPALITREVSELSGREGTITFRIASLKPLNPDNMANAFERDALEGFARGEKEYFSFTRVGNDYFFHYMAPLVTEQSCLTCHAHQGYRIGDIRGGISVTANANAINGQMQRNRVYLILSALGIVMLVFLTIYNISTILIKNISQVEELLIEMAARDSLTGLYNRRETFRQMQDEISRSSRVGRALSVIMIDIDHFKRINDTYGHSAGDAVLQYLATMMRQFTRDYDILCRYGGEEFLILTPETPLDQAAVIARRLCTAVEITSVAVPGFPEIRITISAGVAQLKENESTEQIIARSDAALYRAKQQGRNRVEIEN